MLLGVDLRAPSSFSKWAQNDEYSRVFENDKLKGIMRGMQPLEHEHGLWTLKTVCKRLKR